MKAPACVKATFGEAFETSGAWALLGDRSERQPKVPKSYVDQLGSWWWCSDLIALLCDRAPSGPIRSRTPLHVVMFNLFYGRPVQLRFSADGAGSRFKGKGRGAWYVDTRFLVGIELAVPGVTWWGPAEKPKHPLTDDDLFRMALHALSPKGELVAAVAPRTCPSESDVVDRYARFRPPGDRP